MQSGREGIVHNRRLAMHRKAISGQGAPLLGWLIAGLLLLAACAPASQQPAPKAEQPAAKTEQPTAKAQQPAAKAEQPAAKPGQKTRLTAVYPTDLEGWSPYSHSTSTLYARYMHVFEPIIIWDTARNENVGLLAESWSNPDKNTWEFKLRKDVKFSDGSELTAEDVVFSYTRMTKDKDSKQNSVLAHVERFETPDKYTVRLVTKSPDAALLDRLNNRVILSKAYYEKLGTEAADKKPMGSGPYLFKEWVNGQRFVVEKNPNYWGPNKPTFDEVVFRVISESEATVTALLNGEVDIIGYIPPQLVSRVQNAGNARIEAARGQRLMFLATNPQYKPWDNKTLRQAVNYAIDKEGILKGILEGRAYELKQPIGEGMYGYDPEYRSPYSFNPQKAKELVTQAGYPNGLDVDMQCSRGRYLKDKEICEAMAQMLTQVGIKTKLTTPEWGKFWPDVQEGKVPLYMLGRGNVVDPSEYLHQYFRTGVTKRLQFSSPEVDKMLQDEQQEFNPQQRLKLLRTAMNQIVDEAAMVFLLQYEDTYGVSNRVDWKARGDEYILAWEAKPK
jgi:peptide/nickel transport system substrate-binding protein